MAFEALKAQAYMILNEIAAGPEDLHVLQAQLHETLAEMSGLGLPLPDDLVELEKRLEAGLDFTDLAAAAPKP